MYKIKIFIGLPSLFILWSGLSLLGCENAEKDKKKEAPTSPSLDIIQLKKGILKTEIDLPGELISYQKVDLYAKENSFVKNVLVDIGSEVVKGQLLAQLEAPELLADLNSAKARMKAQEALSISSRFTYSKLLETSKTPGTISPNDLQEALAKKNSDSAQYISAQSNLRAVTDQLSYLSIKAPFNGIISSRNINPGAYVGPSGKGSDSPLFTLEEQGKLRLVISVPEDKVPGIRKGGLVHFEVRSIPGKIFTAKLIRLAGSLSNTLRSERLEMDIDNASKSLLPGMTAMVKLENPALDSTNIVPASSVMETSHGPLVILLDEQNRVKYVPVKRGGETSNLVEIFGNLKPGDHLVRVANEEIRQGTVVKSFTLANY
jgi:RND family efflux transporter MFP subunit